MEKYLVDRRIFATFATQIKHILLSHISMAELEVKDCAPHFDLEVKELEQVVVQ